MKMYTVVNEDCIVHNIVHEYVIFYYRDKIKVNKRK